MLNKDNFISGQILIEILVAMGIFVLVLVSMMTVISTSQKIGNLSVRKMMAENFVQEGMEKVRNIRDYNLKHSDTRTSWLEDINVGNPPYRVESKGETFEILSDLKDLGDGFTRDIDIQFDPTDPSNNTILVTVTVTWSSGTKKVEAKEFLTNWKQ